MGAYVMLVFVIVVANVGGIYFYLQEKKEKRKR
jgi:glucose uptake protein GlcU